MEIGEIETAKKRCESVIRTITHLPLSTSITASCRSTLLKLASSELSFLSSLATDPPPQPLSINIGHIELVLWILRHPSITAVSRVCKQIPLPITNSVHVDLVCTLGKAPVWIIVSDRNPRYISWSDNRHGSKGLRSRIETILSAANSTTALKPSSLILFFANGFPLPVYERLKDRFGAKDFNFGSDSDFDCEETLEGEEWVNVVRTRSYKEAVSVEIKLIDGHDSLAFAEHVVVEAEVPELSEKDALSSVLSSMRLKGEDFLVNFDTTALVALVSGIANGCAERILDMPEVVLEEKFKGNTVFVIAQARSEVEISVLVRMGDVLSGKRGIVCKSVVSEFEELVSMYAGPNERQRAEQLLKSLMVVNDNPTERVMGLPTTRKLAMKNKIVFGTGDRWGAPTLTANMGFVRAVAQSGMSLSTIEHSPRALTGD
ncbi:unnamed protein product [Brassica oleracea]|uniref:DUF1308 domain-containing protein n=2 Tax=Brassica oleracea TaxID=3712 RepID=A0A0D3AQB7_BRAOL|nr:PREDICTED: UPF0415 protein C7orf25 homolog [Brassica oleracea var. oleracea]VDD22984.1 unnamed protein product [Brassica oleracea]